MENFKGHDNKNMKRKVLLSRNLSESALPLNRLPINSIDADNDLRIVGFKVQLNDDEVYSFTLDKARSKSADVLSILAGSNEVYSQGTIQVHQSPIDDVGTCFNENPTVHPQTVSRDQIMISENISNRNECEKNLVLQFPGIQKKEAFQVENEISKDFLNAPMSWQANQNESPKITKNEEGIDNSSTIELKFDATCLKNKEFEIRIKSKNESISSINEQLNSNEDFCEKDQPDDIVKISPGRDGSHYVTYLKISPMVPLECSTEMTSRKVKSETESSAGVETIDLDSNKLEGTCNKSEHTYSSESQDKMIEPLESETEEYFKNQPPVFTEKETVLKPLQTEPAAVLSVKNERGTSRQTEKLVEKSLDVENLPLNPIKLENVTTEENQIEKNCLCSCGHKKQHDCIYNCCHHRDCGDIIPANILFGQNLLYLASMHNALKCNYCRCRLYRSCSESTNNCSEKLKNDTHLQYCCECGKNAKNVTDARTTKNEIQNDGNSKNISLKSRISNSLASKENILRQSQIKSTEYFEPLKEKMKDLTVKMSKPFIFEVETKNSNTIELKPKNFNSLASKEKIAVKVSKPSEIEEARSLDIIDVIGHSLESQSQVESFSSFQQIEKEEINIAVKVSKPSEIETAFVLDTSDVTEHCLDSCNLPQRSQPRIQINPIDVKLSAKVLSESIFEEQIKSNIKFTEDKKEVVVIEELRQIVSGKEKMSVEKKNLDSYYFHTEVCPCSMCHKKTETVQKIENGTKNTSRVFQIEKNGTSKVQSKSTSPSIIPEAFDYITKDGWKPYNRKSDEFSIKKMKAPESFHSEMTSNKKILKSVTETLDDACKIVNDHLLSLSFVDEDEVRKAAHILHMQWFQVVGSKYSDVVEVRNFIQYVEKFSSNLVKTLLHSVDNNSNNVLHFAFANNRFDLVDELLKNGYALDLLNKGNKSGNTPLMICAISRPYSPTNWIVVRKCFEFSDVNERIAKNGQTPLMIAASCGFQSMVDLLLDVSANPNLQDKDGSTALMYAAEHGHERCVKSLMKHRKCDPTIKDKDGETACSIALNNDHKNVAFLIHKQALLKRRSPQKSYSSKCSSFTNNHKAGGRRALAMVPVSDLSNENH